MKYFSFKVLVSISMITSIVTVLFSLPVQADRISDERLEEQRRFLEMRERERQAKQREKEIEKKNKSVMKRNCTIAKGRLREYKTAGALYDVDKNGKKIYLDKAQRKKAEKEAAADVKKWCK